jgi:hypothetical protein
MSTSSPSQAAITLKSPRAFQAVARQTTLSSPQKLADIHADTKVTVAVAGWLARLKILAGVPFAYLVPDEAMLPPESLRFFQVDQNWQHCLIDGAYSVARVTTDDMAHDHAIAPHVHAAADHLVARRLARALGPAAKITQVTGFLLRSGVVAGWPGVKVQCQDATGKVLSDPPLRLECLAPDILLCLVAGVTARVIFQLPPEALHFGIDRDKDTGTLSLSKELRATVASSNGPSLQPGALLSDHTASLSLRDRRVLKVNASASAMRNGLRPLEAAGKFTPAEFAVEMIEGLQIVTFINDDARGNG